MNRFSPDTFFKVGFALGGLSLLIFSLGHLGLITLPYLSLSILVSFVLLFRLLKKGIVPGGVNGQAFLLLDKALLFLIAAFVFFIIPLALTPPSVRDELIHHLAVPKLYIERGAVFEIPFMGVSYFPMNIDLLYLIPLAFGSDVLPRLMHLGFAVLTGLVIYYYLLNETGRSYGLLGMLLFLSTPLVTNLSRMAYVDHGVAFYSLLSLIGAIKWDGKKIDRWIFFSAVSMGLAVGSKYNALIGLFLVTLFVVFISSRSTGSQMQALKTGGFYLLIALAAASPWLIRNYIWKGSPFYPIFGSILGSVAKGEGAHLSGALSPIAKRYILYGESTLDIFLVPLRIFWEGADNSIQRFDGVLNPIYLVFVPLAFIKNRSRDLVVFTLFTLLFFYISFFTVDIVTRYLMPAVPLLIFMIVRGIRNCMETRFLKVPALVLVLGIFIFNTAYLKGLYSEYEPFRYLFGLETRDGYLSRVLPEYRTVKFANSNLPAESRVMFLFTGDRGYYWDRAYYYGDRVGGNLIGFLRSSDTLEDLKGHMTGADVTHLFINDKLFWRFADNNFNEAELALLTGFFQNHAERLHTSNGFSIYAIK